MENNGIQNGEILCTSTPVNKGYFCSNALYWNTTSAFAADLTLNGVFTLSFPKVYVKVSRIKILSGSGLRYLSSSIIDSSLDGVNYKNIMNTDIPFCSQKSTVNCNCGIETIREYTFPEERVLKYLRISGSGKDSCGTTELSFFGIELFGHFTSFCFSVNYLINYSFPFYILTHFFIIFE